MIMQSVKLALLLASSLAALSATGAHASPFYYYFQDAQAPEAGSAEVIKPAEVADSVQQAADKVAASLPSSQQQSQQTGQLPQRIQGHLSDLYSHGSNAMRSVVDTVQPDISNIGKDLSEVYQATRNQVGKRIEPLAQTVRPYIDQAQKAVAPYVNQAKEEVPKLINQAGPALTKVGEQVRDKLSGVLGKLKADGSDAVPNYQQHANSANNIVPQQVEDAAKSAKDAVSGAVQKQQ